MKKEQSRSVAPLQQATSLVVRVLFSVQDLDDVLKTCEFLYYTPLQRCAECSATNSLAFSASARAKGYKSI